MNTQVQKYDTLLLQYIVNFQKIMPLMAKKNNEEGTFLLV